MNKLRKIFLSLGILVVTLPVLAPVSSMKVFAVLPPESGGGGTGDNVLCTVFPFVSQITVFGVDTLCTGVSRDTTLNTTRDTIRFILSLIFVAIIIISVYVVIKGALKYIRSEGNPEKVAEAQKAIKSVFVGIGALFVGLIGIVIILAFFNAGGALSNETPQDANNPLTGILP